MRVLLKPAKTMAIKLSLILGVLLCLQSAFAQSLTFTASMQNETFVSDSGDDVSRMALGAMGVEFEKNFSRKWSVGLLGGAQVSMAEQESLSFGLGGFVNYYFSGSPTKSIFNSDTTYLSGMGRWSYFAGFGVEERFLKSENLSSEVRGGPFVRVGGRYIWNSNMYFTGNFKYLMAGADYSSIELVFGLGFYL